MQRVDKFFKDKDAKDYSTEAIVNTLNHYGVAANAEQMPELFKTRTSVEVAHDWFESWKGTGQFSQFPAWAASVLFSRVNPGALDPAEVTVPLMAFLQSLEAGDSETMLDARLRVLEALTPKLEAQQAQFPATPDVVMTLLPDEYLEIYLGLMGNEAFEKWAMRFLKVQQALEPKSAQVLPVVYEAFLDEAPEKRSALVAAVSNVDHSWEACRTALDYALSLELEVPFALAKPLAEHFLKHDPEWVVEWMRAVYVPDQVSIEELESLLRAALPSN